MKLLPKSIVQKLLQPEYEYLHKNGLIEKFLFEQSRSISLPRQTIFDLSVFGFDISAYQLDTDFHKMKNYGTSFLILRMAFGTAKDTWFDTYIKQAPLVGLPISLYQFYDPTKTPKAQADLVVSLATPYKHLINRIWLDLEFWWDGAYKDPQHWKTYRDIIKAAGFNVGWYTRKTWWDSRVGTYASEFAKDPCWAAQYFDELTLIPKGWPTAMIWQKGTPAIGLAAGVTSKEIDLDIWNNDFHFSTEWSKVGTAIQDSYSILAPGIEQYTGIRNNWKFFLQRIDPTKVKYELARLNPLETVSSIANKKNAFLATNGGEWDRVSSPKDYSVSNGIEYVARKEPVPSLMVLDTGSVVIDHKNTVGVSQALSGLRYILLNGTIPTYLYGTEPQYTEGHSRTIEGVTSDGKHIQMVSEGAYPNQGLTLKQCAEIMKQYGAITAFDSGGGGDSTLVVNKQLINKPENIVNGVNVERYLPQALLIYPKGDTMTLPVITAVNYEVWSTTNDMSLRNDANIGSPKQFTIVRNTIMKADKLATYAADDVNVKAGDKWVHVYQYGSFPCDGWVALVHLGVTYCTFKDMTPPPPPPPPPTDSITADLNLYDVKVAGDQYQALGVRLGKIK